MCLDLEVLPTALVAMREVRFEDSSTRSSATFRLAAYRQSTCGYTHELYISTLKSENKRSIYYTLRKSEQVIQPPMTDRILDEFILPVKIYMG